MALSEALTETSICNMALDELGANRIKGLVDDEQSVQAIKCRTHYETTRDALIRSHKWRFASGRKTLTVNPVAPDTDEWSFQYPLPDDFISMKSIYEGRFSDENFRSYALEGNILLSNDDTMEIRYVKKVTDVTKFDSLFIEVFVLSLALKLIVLAGATPKIKDSLSIDLSRLMVRVRAMDGQETNTAGRLESGTWNDARYSSNNPGIY
jgi:hypothetical protein